MKRWHGLVMCLALAGCLRDPELQPGNPDGGGRLDGGQDQSPRADRGLDASGDAEVDRGLQGDTGLDKGVEPAGDRGLGDRGLDGEPEDAEPTDQGPPADRGPDGATDGRPPGCLPGEARICGSDVGACVAGAQICLQGDTWSQCFDAVGPEIETCNGLDDDCDGVVDEDASLGCGSGVGACEAGLQLCEAGVLGACLGQVDPSDERCNGLDDDCDGEVDEELSRACGSNQGVCVAGVEICRGGVYADCDAPVLPGQQPELCDGVLDDDCDGVVDEGCACAEGASRPCGNAVGACEPGEQSCVAGQWGECVGAVGPQAEICDGRDTDCNGQIDDAPGVGQPCSVGVGACRRGGSLACAAGAAGPQCDAVAGPPQSEACNQVDDDCDGRVDEAVAPVLRRHVIGAGLRVAEPIPALVPFGDGWAALWLEVEPGGGDVGVRFARFDGGGALEVGPVWIQEPNSDYFPSAVALATDGRGFIFAVGSDSLGGPEGVVGSLDPAGEIGRGEIRLQMDRSPSRMDLAWADRQIAVVWDEVGPDSSAVYFHQSAGLEGFARGRQIGPAREPARAPSVSHDGEAFGVLFTRFNNNEFVVTLARVGVRDVILGTVDVARNAQMGRLRFVPELGAYAATWIAQVGRLSAVNFGWISPAADQAPAAIELARGAAIWPDLALKPGPDGAPPAAVSVVWSAGEGVAGAGPLRTRTLAPSRGGWVAVGDVLTLDAEAVGGARSTWQPRTGQYGVLYLRPALDPQRAETRLLRGPLGCETAP